MNRTAAALVTSLVATGVLTACGGDSPYCAAVKQNQAALDSFGKRTTDAAFAKEAEAVRTIAATEPDNVATDWRAIDKAMRGVLAAQKKTKLTFADLADPDTRAEADSDDIETVNKAYSAFNDTAKQRLAVVRDVSSTCEVDLS